MIHAQEIRALEQRRAEHVLTALLVSLRQRCRWRPLPERYPSNSLLAQANIDVADEAISAVDEPLHIGCQSLDVCAEVVRDDRRVLS